MLSSKSIENGILRILSELDSAGRGKKEGRGGRRDEEEGGMRRKDGQGGRMDAKKGATWRKER